MRPSQKSGRSRGKNNNRNRPVGHSPNRVYESAGPEGKVRGTPQQVIDKYLSLARDAQLSGDRVTAENFLQHAEHYSRLLLAAQEASGQDRRDQNQQFGGGEQPNVGGSDNSDDKRSGNQNNNRNNNQNQQQPQPQPQPEPQKPAPAPAAAEEAAKPEAAPEAKPETEEQPKPTRRRRSPAKPKAAPAEDDQPSSDGLGAIDAAQGEPEIVDTPESKAKPAERRPRRPRAKPAAKDTAKDEPSLPLDPPAAELTE